MKNLEIREANGSRRSSIDCSEPKLTDQSDAKSADINHIMKVYQKTGVLPHTKAKLAVYVDNTGLPSLEEAHSMVQSAKEAFMELPSNIRKLMDNDPTKLVGFINDPQNQGILIEYGIIDEPAPVVQEEPAPAPVEQPPA